MPKLAEKKKCTGCTACAQSCPRRCLVMTRDEEGFFRPELASDTDCVHCGICEEVCPVLHENNRALSVKAYACWLKDTKELSNSTSGGVFYAAGRQILKQDGRVWGAAYEGNLNVAHHEASDVTQLSTLRKSKYVESDLGNSFIQIRNTLDSGTPVLFTGTPCQAAGLQAFLGKAREQCVIMQVFCSQVFGELVWRRYLDGLAKNYNSPVASFTFRSKPPLQEQAEGLTKGGWKDPHECWHTADGRYYEQSHNENSLIHAFGAGLIGRPSCSNCKFKLKSTEVAADLAVGDFWGCEISNPEYFNPMGVSAVITYTQKGKDFLLSLSDELEIHEVKAETIFSGNPGACEPMIAHVNRDMFYQELRNGKRTAEELFAVHLGLPHFLNERPIRFGLFGGYNTRTAILDLCAGTKSQLVFHYSNSSLISLMAEPVRYDNRFSLPRNTFRAEALLADMNKGFLERETGKEVDYILLDFMEERFDLVQYDDSYITFSDALADTGYAGGKRTNRLSEQTESLWKDSCLRFINYLLTHYSPEQVILVRGKLSEKHGRSDTDLQYFENKEDIQAINQILDRYYDFFEANYPLKHKIKPEPDILAYCDDKHKHGVLPCHANPLYCKKLSTMLLKEIC